MQTEAQIIDIAISKLSTRSVFRNGELEYEVRSLFPIRDWRPVSEPWWKKKEACVIGEDSCGNLYLRVCDGTVRFWDHETEKDEILAPSVTQFVSALSAPSPHVLKTAQVIKSWIDPDFLKTLKENEK